MARTLKIMQSGLNKFAVCERCNAEFSSSFLNQSKAEGEIREKFDTHRCNPLDKGLNVLTCAICGKTCDLETCKTASNGRGVHAECLASIIVRERIPPSSAQN